MINLLSTKPCHVGSNRTNLSTLKAMYPAWAAITSLSDKSFENFARLAQQLAEHGVTWYGDARNNAYEVCCSTGSVLVRTTRVGYSGEFSFEVCVTNHQKCY